MDWNYWLGRKYGIMQQNANADTTRANAGMLSAQAGANFDNVRAGLLPAESKANIGLTAAQTGLTNANTRQTDTETKYIGPKTMADIFATRAQGGYYNSEAAGNNATNRLFSIGNNFGYGMPNTGNSALDEIVARSRSGFGWLQ